MFQKQFSKLQYLPCQQVDHNGEVLSLVCVDKTCKQSRQLCPICEHTSYPNMQTIPLRLLLNNINKVEQIDQEGINLLEVAMFLDRSHLDSLKSINKFQEQITSITQSITIKVNDYFNNIKKQLKSFVDKQVPNHVIMDYFQSNSHFFKHSSDNKQIEQYLNQIIQNYQFSSLGEATKMNLYQGVMNSCSSKYSDIQNKLNELQKEVEKRATLITDMFPIQIIEAVAVASTSFFTSTFQQYKFSNTLKGQLITVQNGNLVAEQTGSESNGQRFIICEPMIPSVGKTKFGFKVIKYSGWVGIGVCHKSVIQTANFKFNYTNIGHGSYLISNNSYSWSHLQKDLNSAHKSFDFAVGDIIYVQVDYDAKIVTWKKNDTTTQFQMNIDVSQELYPCANLCSPGDKVEMVNEVQDIKF